MIKKLVVVIPDFYESKKKGGSKSKILVFQKRALSSRVNPIKVTPIGQTLNKETVDFEEHIMGNSSALESTFTKMASFSNVIDPINHEDLLESQILEIDKELNKFDISEREKSSEIGNPKKACEDDPFIDEFKKSATRIETNAKARDGHLVNLHDPSSILSDMPE